MRRLPIWCFYVTGEPFVATFQTTSFL